LQPSVEAASSGWQVPIRKESQKRCKKTGQPSLAVKPKEASASGGETAKEDMLLGSPLIVERKKPMLGWAA